MPRDYTNQSPTAFQRRPHLTRDDDWIRAFLKEARIGRIASSIDGQPFINTSTFWFDEENHQIAFHSNVAGRIRSNIESNPKVCLEASILGNFLPSNVALEFSLQFRSVIVFGNARVVKDPGGTSVTLWLDRKILSGNVRRERISRDHRQGITGNIHLHNRNRIVERQGKLGGTCRSKR